MLRHLKHFEGNKIKPLGLKIEELKKGGKRFHLRLEFNFGERRRMRLRKRGGRRNGCG